MAAARMVLDADFRVGGLGDEVAVVFTRCPCCGCPAPQLGDRYVVVSFTDPRFVDPLKFVFLLACAAKMVGKGLDVRARRAKVADAVVAVGKTLEAIVSESYDGRVRADILAAPAPGLQ